MTLRWTRDNAKRMFAQIQYDYQLAQEERKLWVLQAQRKCRLYCTRARRGACERVVGALVGVVWALALVLRVARGALVLALRRLGGALCHELVAWVWVGLLRFVGRVASLVLLAGGAYTVFEIARAAVDVANAALGPPVTLLVATSLFFLVFPPTVFGL